MEKYKQISTKQCGAPNTYRVLKDFENFKRGEIYKECFSTDGKNKRYYTKGLGDISVGDFGEYPELFELLDE